MRRARWGRMALTILTKSVQEQGVLGKEAVAARIVPAEDTYSSGLRFEGVQ